MNQLVEDFTTASGSTYQVDLESHRIRRVGNASALPPTPRQGQDGQWRGYHELRRAPFPSGEVSIAIVWAPAGACTLTSPLLTASPRLARLVAEPNPDAQT